MLAPCVALDCFRIPTRSAICHIIRARAVAIVRIIVVECARTVHVTLVVRVRRVRSAKPPVPRSNSKYPMLLFRITFSVRINPSLQFLPCVND